MLNLFTQAHQIAGRSKDPSTKVGALVYSSGTVVGVGCNHLPEGVPDDWWDDREKKYQAVVHAEVAAILNAGRLAYGATLVVTHHPCKECAKVIVAAGIICVVCPSGPWRDDPAIIDSVEKSRELLNLCDVDIIEVRANQ